MEGENPRIDIVCIKIVKYTMLDILTVQWYLKTEFLQARCYLIRWKIGKTKTVKYPLFTGYDELWENSSSQATNYRKNELKSQFYQI